MSDSTDKPSKTSTVWQKLAETALNGEPIEDTHWHIAEGIEVKPDCPWHSTSPPTVDTTRTTSVT